LHNGIKQWITACSPIYSQEKNQGTKLSPYSQQTFGSVASMW